MSQIHVDQRPHKYIPPLMVLEDPCTFHICGSIKLCVSVCVCLSLCVPLSLSLANDDGVLFCYYSVSARSDVKLGGGSYKRCHL